jgi:two-component system, chemotaxis family, chemotaxis protein CheY
VGHEQLDMGGNQRPVRQADLVLVVDDEPSVAETVELLIQQAGYQVLVAHSGQEALAKTEQQWPAVVISDVMMPRMDGSTFIAALRTRADQWQMPMPAVVLMTAASDRVVDGIKADVIIHKPFDIDVMEAEVHALMRRETP